MTKLKVLKKSDEVMLTFGEWFDKTYGNTYYDVEIEIGDKQYSVECGYGYNVTSKQSIDEALAAIGYRVRHNAKNVHLPYSHLYITKETKLKRELFKTTGLISSK